MQLRREERRQSAQGAAGAAVEPHPLALPASASKRLKGSPAARSPAASHGAAAAAAGEEPDPRLCLWEPPVSPFGLLGKW